MDRGVRCSERHGCFGDGSSVSGMRVLDEVLKVLVVWVVYFPTCCVEGSRHRRPGGYRYGNGTTIRGVVPDRCRTGTLRVDSGAGTAFLTTNGLAFARVTQHHPVAEQRAKTHPTQPTRMVLPCPRLTRKDRSRSELLFLRIFQ